MLELIGVFSDKRAGSVVTFKQKHMLLHNIVWLTFGDRSTIVPLVGSPREMHDHLTAHHGVSFAYPTVKDLLNGSKPKIKDKDG
eukprot:377943-Prymnesium_polylepis.1